MASHKATLSPWESAFAGAFGAVVANGLIYPVDIIKTKMQVQDKLADGANSNQHYTSTWDALVKIYSDEGTSGLYAGLEGSLLGTFSSGFAYFFWYSQVRSTWVKYSPPGAKPTTAVELSLGAVAGALAQLFTIPVSVVTTRQQTTSKHERKSLWGTTTEIIDSEDGVSGLWRGLKASLVLCVNPAITYGAYERLKDGIYSGRKNLRPHEAFILGALSKAIATFATQPLIVAKVGLQSKPPPSRKGKPFKSFPEVMSHIIQHEGIFGLFKGLGPQLLKAVSVQGLLMMTKERIEFMFILFFRWVASVRAKSAARVNATVQPIQSIASEKIGEFKQATTVTLAAAQAQASEKLAEVQHTASDKLAAAQSIASAKISAAQVVAADKLTPLTSAASEVMDRAKSHLPAVPIKLP